MAEIRVNVSANKTQKVEITPGQVQNQITATPDSSQYYSNLSKSWAIDDNLVQGTDYSSKYYAGKSSESATIAESYANAAVDTFNNVQVATETSLANIETARVEAVDNITTVKSESIASVEAKGNEVLSTVNTGIAELEDITNDLVNEINTTGRSYDNLTHKQITNCLLEVPQNIKLELNDGVLTLKAGSEVIIPNGFEADGTTPKFDYVTVESDVVRTGTVNTTGISMAYYNPLGSLIVLTVVGDGTINNYFSGATAPTSTNYMTWYDTANNTVKTTSDKGATWYSGSSLPLGIVSYSADSAGFTSINQVFNGMGYIGSTVWVDKGVKGLIPNGRNEDGSLKNAEFVTKQLFTYTMPNFTFVGISPCLYMDYPTKPNIIYNGEIKGVDYIGNKQIGGTPLSVGWWFDIENNYWKYSGVISRWVPFGLFDLTNGVISNFQPKLPFRAVDYNDYRTEVDSKVSKAGDTMSGNLNIERAGSAYFGVCNTTMKIGDAPSERVNLGGLYIRANDSSANNLAGIVQGYIPAKTDSKAGVGLQIITRHPNNTTWGAGLSLVTYSDGTPYFEVPKCTTKATTASTASTGRVAVIVQNYKNGNSWYRVWSDGWIEQGGIVESIPSNGTKTVTFLKAFTTTNYYINCNQPMKATYSFETCGITTRATTSFTVHQKSYNGDGGAFNSAWYACGY